jgi:hypothetical protein
MNHQRSMRMADGLMCRVLICPLHKNLDPFRFSRVPFSFFRVDYAFCGRPNRRAEAIALSSLKICKINRNGINAIGYDRNSESAGMIDLLDLLHESPSSPSPFSQAGRRGAKSKILPFKVPLPLWERRCPELVEGDLGRGNDIRARGLLIELN